MTWKEILKTHGPITVIALFLIYWLTTGISEELAAHIDATSRLEYYLRQVCLNTANSEAERAGCIPPMGPGR
jgi:hypothetical protein